MDRKKELIEDFREKVDQMANHYEQIHRIQFSASLKNGTGFHFTYNSDQLDAKETKYVPASVMNAVFDIIGCLVAIAALCYMAVGVHRTPGLPFVTAFFMLTSYSLYIADLVVEAVYHLYSKDSISRVWIRKVADMLRTITLASASISLFPEKSTVLLFCVVMVAALAYLMLSISSIVSTKIHYAAVMFIPCIPLFADTQFTVIAFTVLAILWVLPVLCLPKRIDGRTNTIFAGASVIMLMINHISMLQH